ncbi:hypothetical protein ACUUL3_01990 [Thiovibrio sp. JS02]
MTRQLSFSKYENQTLPGFRDKTNLAKSPEDIKKFFGYTTRTLLDNIFAGKMTFDHTDIVLDDAAEPYYAVSERLLSSEEFTEIWRTSDLPHVTGRLAKTAMNRYKHLLKHPEKTNSKIRM